MKKIKINIIGDNKENNYKIYSKKIEEIISSVYSENSSKFLYNTKIIVNELLKNAIEYSNPTEVMLLFDFKEDELKLQISNFNTDKEAPDIKSICQKEINKTISRGRGLKIIKTLSDNFEISDIKNGWLYNQRGILCEVIIDTNK